MTGAGKGLGRAYAMHLAARGARVIVNNRSHDTDEPGVASADLVVTAIRAYGGEAVANYDSIEDSGAGGRIVQQALDTWGRLDILINNAGVDQAASFHSLDLKDFRAAFEINFFGSLAATHAAYRVMRAAKYGRIVFNVSTAGLHGNHGMTSYSAAKAALIGLMRALAVEGRSRDVLVNAVAPYAATQMTEPYLAGDIASMLRPEQVAPLMAWLVSADCGIAGEIFVVGGGWVRRAAIVENAGAPIPVGEDSQQFTALADGLRDMTSGQEFCHANASFADFLRMMRKQ